MAQRSSRPHFKISVFLSYPKPCTGRQQQFIDGVYEYLDGRGFAPRTLGVTDYDVDAPLKAIRRLMLESNGLITVAFRRAFIKDGMGNYQADLVGAQTYSLSGRWLTSPWAHMSRRWHTRSGSRSCCSGRGRRQRRCPGKGCCRHVHAGVRRERPAGSVFRVARVERHDLAVGKPGENRGGKEGQPAAAVLTCRRHACGQGHRGSGALGRARAHQAPAPGSARARPRAISYTGPPDDHAGAPPLT